MSFPVPGSRGCLPKLAMTPGPVRWGVLGVSELVGRKAVLPALQHSPTAIIQAIGSRDLGRAEAERRKFGAQRAHGSYQEVLEDPLVEAVYIPLPNALHLPWTLAAAKAGKHVLCEKPLACTAAEAGQMAKACEDGGVLLMEAYMTPFHPRHARSIEIARSGRLGEMRFAHTAFTFTASEPPPSVSLTLSPSKGKNLEGGRRESNYRWLPEMGGGALLDVGVYCLAPLLAIAGRQPGRVDAIAVVGSTGVDTSFSGWLDFGDGFTASFECSFEAPEQQLLEVTGTLERMTVEHAFTPEPADATIGLTGGDELTGGNDPYLAMVEHFAAAVRGEAKAARTSQDSIALLALIDELRDKARINGSLFGGVA